MLELRSVVRSYGDEGAGNRLLVLDHVSLTVEQNQFVCLLGPSGCGKTTLLRIMAGLAVADRGEVLLDGKPIRGPGGDRSMVFQNYGLLPWRNVMGNVELGLEMRGMAKGERREICRHYIGRMGLAGYEGHYPHQISGGMQQRVALARAFAKDPKVLLMDEPFAAVDAQTRERLQDELLTVWTALKTTVIFVTHSIEEAIYLGDRVIVMGANPGRIEADIATDLPRPRNAGGEDVKATAGFGALRRKIREMIDRGAAADARS